MMHMCVVKTLYILKHMFLDALLGIRDSQDGNKNVILRDLVVTASIDPFSHFDTSGQETMHREDV